MRTHYKNCSDDLTSTIITAGLRSMRCTKRYASIPRRISGADVHHDMLYKKWTSNNIMIRMNHY